MFCNTCGTELKDGVKFCTKCGAKIQVSQPPRKLAEFFTNKKTFVAISILLLLVIGILALFSDLTNRKPSTSQENLDIASAVVNIYCEGKTEEESSGGSGTIMTEGGLVLTNAHIIPEGAEDSVSCLVILPDSSTGSPKEIYYAYPIVFPEISEKYDLAFLLIDDVFVDEDGEIYGDYPKVFPAYDDSKYCTDENIILGESVRIYGYPSLSGGTALTITNGVVSSLLIDEGLIITSAQISSGNSGGLAVDQYGCRIGIPAMVYEEENESLGVIISNDLIAEFTNEVLLLDGYNNQ